MTAGPAQEQAKKYPPDWADEPSDARCGCGARAVIVHAGWGDGDVLACSASGFTCTVCPNQVASS